MRSASARDTCNDAAKTAFGYGPKTLARVLRLQRALGAGPARRAVRRGVRRRPATPTRPTSRASNCDGLGLGNFLEFPGVEDRYPPKLEIMNRDIVPLGTVAIHAATADPGTGLQSFNGLGGFNGDGEYEIHLTGSDLPPAPWINVVGNPTGGFLVSEGGSGTTWAGQQLLLSHHAVAQRPGAGSVERLRLSARRHQR